MTAMLQRVLAMAMAAGHQQFAHLKQTVLQSGGNAHLQNGADDAEMQPDPQQLLDTEGILPLMEQHQHDHRRQHPGDQ